MILPWLAIIIGQFRLIETKAGHECELHIYFKIYINLNKNSKKKKKKEMGVINFNNIFYLT